MAIDIEKGIELKLRFKADRRLHYKLTTTVNTEIMQEGTVLREQETAFVADLEQRTICCDEAGHGHIVSLTVPKEPPPPPGTPRQLVYQEIAPLGRVLESTGANPTNSYSFPEMPVAKGSSWEGSSRIPIPNRPDPVICKNTYTIEGSETINGFDCVVIEVVTEELEFEFPLPGGQGTAKVVMAGSGLIHFAPESGFIVRMEMETISSPRIGLMTYHTSNVIVQELQRVDD
ncbi:MAG: hypothetical protein KC910_10085 [Candidatus Eremiobacteraeota bacterium]|nr:hypothetical protein [Candidatus Eremiobacteraeota bacterium]